MKYSQIFGKTKREASKDELTKNAQLLVRAGFVNKLMAGVYSYLPLGLRVINKIEKIVREEMDNLGANEIFMPALQPSENWKKTGGWEKIDVLFKLKSRTDKDYALGQSHEEVVTPLAKEYINSYKDLPMAVYQIQQKFRDELRAKSGILRGREFRMKDMYSWHRDQEDFDRFYEEVKKAYLRIFERCGLVAKVTEASGGSFTDKISYEFMVLTDAGEDDILYCNGCSYCVNKEITDLTENAICPKCKNGKLSVGRASEVGNVFDLGEKFCSDFEFSLIDEKGEKFYPKMGCYGIGISRLMGVIVEKYTDERGIVWPESVPPFKVNLINIGNFEYASKIYKELEGKGIEVLWDDREIGPGQKFSDCDLIGCPIRLVVSERNGEKIEWKRRDKEEIEMLSLDEVLGKI